MNKLLKNGILSNDWILGAPAIVSLFTIISLVIFIIVRKHIYKLFQGSQVFKT
jgi:hypothetical protein